MLVSIYSVSLKVDLLSVTFDPETAEIHLLIVSDPPLGSHYVTTIIVAMSSWKLNCDLFIARGF